MKLFGKKTLALLLALAMVMPMCVFATEGGEQTPPAPVAVTGVSLSKNAVTLAKGGTVDLTATVSPDNATDKTVTWSSGDAKIATVDANGKVTAVGGGTATITAAAGGVSDTCEVTVTGDTIKSVAPVAIDVAYGTTVEKAAEALGNKEVDVTYVSDGTGKEKISGWAAKGEYKADVPGNYTFECAEYGATATVTVKKATLKSDTTVGAIAFPVDTDTEDIADEIDEEFGEIDLEFNELEDEIEVTIGGKDSDDYDGWDAPSDFDEEEVGTYTFTAKANSDSEYDDYCDLEDLKLTVVIYAEDYEMEVERGGKSLSALATQLNTVLNALYGEDLDTVIIADLDLEGGILYTDSDCDTELEEDELSKSEFAALYYVPNGTGEDSVIEFEAYYDEDEEDDVLEGSITLVADPYMMISFEVSDGDVISMDAEEFEEQFLEQDKDYEELSYVTFSHTNSKSKGYLYYDYDEEDEKGDAVKSSKCYVDPDDDDDIDLDDVVFVAGDDMEAGTYTITFTAKGYKDGSSSLKTETGYLIITYIEKADITVEAGKGETVDVDADLFQDYLEDEVKTSKSLNIVSVAISGAPRNKNAGYLVTDGKELTKSGTKTFFADPDDDEYELDDIQFRGGSKATTTNGIFKITYTTGSSSTKKTVEGTIDFIVGVSRSLNGSIVASKVFSFGDTVNLNAFKSLGDNDNVYVEFTSLPVGGKLFYNYGTASQEDVTIGTDYYLTTSAGKKQLRYVTFVPSYSSSKIDKTVTFNVKGYDNKDKAVTGTVNIAVDYATTSAYFTDVATSTYADSVDFLYNKGITTGMTTTTFGPNTNVTRGQFVTFLYRAAGQPTVTAANKFTDVKASDYYYNAVRWAVQNGITTGRSATSFDPNANVTYQEIMTFLYRYDVTYLKHTGVVGSSSVVYDYAKVDTWAQTAVKWAVGKGVLTAGNLNPTTAGTRANVALYLHRMLTL